MVTWTYAYHELALALQIIWSEARWHTWENETTDNWEDWGG